MAHTSHLPPQMEGGPSRLAGPMVGQETQLVAEVVQGPEALARAVLADLVLRAP